jgi:hypothetical protein
VQRFLANAAQRFNGRLDKTGKNGVYRLIPGDLESRLANLFEYSFPLEVTFDRLADKRAEYLGRTHPLIEFYCQEVLGRAFAPEPDELFARAGAMFTDAVSWRTCLLLVRCRYLLKEVVEEFAEEVVVVAFQRQEGRLVWLTPLEEAGRQLLETAQPVANMPREERLFHINWALEILQKEDWYAPLVEWRIRKLQESHQRLRSLVQAPSLAITPHLPPDVLGCYVLVPAGGKS